MTALSNSIKVIISITLLSLLAACTTASVEQDLQPQVQTAETAQTQTAEANSLAAQTEQTPGQNVTESQLQQQTSNQLETTTPSQTVQTPTATQEVASLETPVDTSKALTFLPFEGAPQTKTASLNRLLNSSAQTNGLTILPATRTGAKYRVKGYFSALNDGNGTMLVYVWDVVDGTGKRLHRINGRERTGTSRTDPWQAITDKEMQRVAEATTSRLKTWVDKR